MILRSPIVSVNPVRVAVEDRRAPAAATRAEVVVRAEVVPVALAPAVDPRPAITAELVAAWLDEQDAEARRAVAAVLAGDIEAEYAAARSRGRAAGADEARERAEVERTKHVEALERFAADLQAATERDNAALAASCGEIVLEVLKKVAGPLLAAPDAVAGAVAQVLQRRKDGQEVVVRVRPSELETLTAAKPVLVRALGGATLTLVADQRVELGGCIVESQAGNLDGRIEVQLNELYETLRLAKAEGRTP